jgi:hypothetical protein
VPGQLGVHRLEALQDVADPGTDCLPGPFEVVALARLRPPRPGGLGQGVHQGLPLRKRPAGALVVAGVLGLLERLVQVGQS